MISSVKKILQKKWELKVVHLLSEVENYLRQTSGDAGDVEDAVRKAYLAGASRGYWDGVRDGVASCSEDSREQVPATVLADA